MRATWSAVSRVAGLSLVGVILSGCSSALVGIRPSEPVVLVKAKPKDFKGGDFIKAVHVSSTMGPGLKLDANLYKTKETVSE